jgi:hydrazine synthase alpha subunit-like protein
MAVSRSYRIWLLSALLVASLICCRASSAQGADLALAQGFRTGEGLARLAESGIEQIVFGTRLSYDDPHWYANIAYYCDDENHKAYAGNGQPDESKLYRLDTASGEVRVLLDAQGGGVRDPHVHYDGTTVLFSYRPAETDHYNLYEIQADGSGLRRVTDVPYDDYEAAYLPDDDIVFVSTRSMRWVGCWMTQVGTLFRCDRHGRNVRPLSVNLEHDNTPAVLPDGRILYTRWEYVDRSQVGYHQLWTMNPDGTNVATYFGNQQHYPLFIDAGPIPGTDELLLINSPGHGRSDHRGRVCTVTSRYGPDDERGCRRITPKANFNDPAPIDKESFLVASHKQLLLGMQAGDLTPVLTCQGNANIHEPVLVRPRPRERIVVDHTDPDQATGRMFLADMYTGRSMEGIEPGQIKKLLVLEILPKPVNFSGGMDLTSWLGTFTLERVLGTVPVEDDGSAYFEVPAGRPVFFVALDANDMSVKRMQSFTNVMPGETLGCVGCHEQRMQTPAMTTRTVPTAVQRSPSKIESFAGLPDVIDFRRHVQPILDARCVSCHSCEKREGRVALTDDLGPCWSISYYTLLATGQVADGRNGLGNQKPRTIGSVASELMSKIDGSHYDVTLTADEWRTVWLWLESGAPYAGTYAALRNAEDQARQGMAHAVAGSAVLNQTCRQCHGLDKTAPPLPLMLSEEERRKLVREGNLAPHERIVREDDYRFSPHVLVNMSRPEHSPVLLGPLPEAADGWGTCAHQFAGLDDPNYQQLLTALQDSKRRYDAIPRFGMAGFKPNAQYVREMKRFGVLPASFDLARDGIDVFETDQRYWKRFWYQPDSESPWPYLP